MYPEIIRSDNWIDCIIDNTLNYYEQRKVVIWGHVKISSQICQRLKERNVETAFFVDSDEKKTNNWDTYLPQCLENKVNEYYVVIPLRFYETIRRLLVAWGYEKNRDYYYFCDSVVTETDDYYEDAHGNIIEGYHKNLSFAFFGFNARLFIGEHPRFYDVKMDIGNEANIKIGKQANIVNTSFSIGKGGKLILGNDSLMFWSRVILAVNAKTIVGNHFIMRKNGSIRCRESGKLLIGNNGSCQTNNRICVMEDSEIKIGNDCMFSHDIYLYSGDGHSIFDVKTGENTNSTMEIHKQSSISIGNHVWIGLRCIILYNTEIGDGSIIGAGSLIKNKIPNNCIAVGQPFRIICNDIAWTKKSVSKSISECGQEYVNLTVEDEMSDNNGYDGCTK